MIEPASACSQWCANPQSMRTRRSTICPPSRRNSWVWVSWVSGAAARTTSAAALLEAVAVGDLTPAEASELGKLVEAYIKALEATDFAERLDKLERMTNR